MCQWRDNKQEKPPTPNENALGIEKSKSDLLLFITKNGERMCGLAFKDPISNKFMWTVLNQSTNIWDINVAYWMPYPDSPT